MGGLKFDDESFSVEEEPSLEDELDWTNFDAALAEIEERMSTTDTDFFTE